MRNWRKPANRDVTNLEFLDLPPGRSFSVCARLPTLLSAAASRQVSIFPPDGLVRRDHSASNEEHATGGLNGVRILNDSR